MKYIFHLLDAGYKENETQVCYTFFQPSLPPTMPQVPYQCLVFPCTSFNHAIIPFAFRIILQALIEVKCIYTNPDIL